MDRRPSYVIHTNIAGIEVVWVTNCVSEDRELRRVLKYHLRSPGEASGGGRHTVTFTQVVRQTEIPADAQPVWEGPYMGLTTSRNKVSWVHSPSDGLDYLTLSDEIVVIHDRANFSTRCELLSREKDGMWIRPRIWDALVIMLHTVMSMHGRYSIHSAAVGLGGGAHLFVGESGHGKSTLCTDLVALGADYMGDDLTFLYLEEGKVMVGSLLMEAKLFPDKKAREKDWIDVVARSGCGAPLALPLRNVYYVARAKGPCRLERHESIDCMITLIKASNNVRMQYDTDLWQSTYETASVNNRFYRFNFGDRKSLTREIFDNA